MHNALQNWMFGWQISFKFVAHTDKANSIWKWIYLWLFHGIDLKLCYKGREPEDLGVNDKNLYVDNKNGYVDNKNEEWVCG